MDQSDEELIAAYLRGAEAAFGELVARHLRGVYSFALRLTGSEQEADDITQETFVKAWKNLAKYDPRQARFKTWVLRIARNTCVDHLRKRTNVPLSVFDDAEGGNAVVDTLADPAPLADEALAALGDTKELERALGELPPAAREVVVLHNQSGLTFEEIGVLLGSPANTVKSRHRRALHRLRDILRI